MKWWDKPYNTVVGCTPQNECCVHCWAREMYERLHPGKKFSEIRLCRHVIDKPLRKQEKTTYFTCNCSDLFHPDVPDDYIHEVYAAMTLACWHNFFVLTKQPQRALGLLTRQDAYEQRLAAARNVRNRTRMGCNVGVSDPRAFPPHNIAFGVTVGTQQHADEFLPLLLKVPAWKRFVSYEPALGPVVFAPWMQGNPKIDWIVAGGENHHDARECNVVWLRSVIEEGRRWGVPVMIKQVGTRPSDRYWQRWPNRAPDDGDVTFITSGDGVYKIRRLKSRGGKDPSEWPEDLRVHETLEFGYPNITAQHVSRAGSQATKTLWLP